MKPFTIILGRRAAQDLDAAKEKNDPAAIDRELSEKFRLLAECPEMGAPMRIEGGFSPTDRYLLLSRCHRVLYYRPDMERGIVLVLRVPHERERPPKKL
jgi:plasmid stabilization system protein ParE